MHGRSLQSFWLFATPWTIAHQAPLSMGFCRQEYWSELPCPPPEDLPNPGFEPRSPTLQADSSPFGPPGEPVLSYFCHQEEKYGKIHGKLGKYLFDFVDIYKLRVMSASSSKRLDGAAHTNRKIGTMVWYDIQGKRYGSWSPGSLWPLESQGRISMKTEKEGERGNISAHPITSPSHKYW